jgi:hypothetical protein
MEERDIPTIKKAAKEQNIGMKDLFSFIRLALTGQAPAHRTIARAL